MAHFACNTLNVEISKNGVAEIALNRPEVHNAINEELITELIDILKQLDDDPQVRILCLRGEGSSFCAGADVAWMQKTITYSHGENIADALKLSELLDTLYRFSKPTIAIVHGAVYGGGIGLVACCDIALANSDAYFCLAEAKLGLIPATIAPYIVAALGPRAVRYWTLTAEPFAATQAETLGLLHEVSPTFTKLTMRKRELIEQILKNGPHALIAAKKLLERVTSYKMDITLQEELAELIAEIRISEEAQTRMSAFIEKSGKNK